MSRETEEPSARSSANGTSATHSPLRRSHDASNPFIASPLRLGLGRPSEPEVSSEMILSRRNSQTSIHYIGTVPNSEPSSSSPTNPGFPTGQLAALVIEPAQRAGSDLLPDTSRPSSIISRASTLSNAATVPFPSIFPAAGSDSAPGLLSPPKGRTSAQLLRAQSQTGSTRKSPVSQYAAKNSVGNSSLEHVDAQHLASPLSAKAKGKQRADLPYTPRQRERGLGIQPPSHKDSQGSLRTSPGSGADAGGTGPPAPMTSPDWPPDQSVKRFPPRTYYVLTNAGKPVFCSHEAEADEDQLTNMMGVAQAIISIYAEEGDKIRSIQAGKLRVVFLLRPPLYLFCTSEWGEPEYVLRNHLDYLHLQMLSVVTGSQLTRVFQKRSNFDLRRLLEGTDTFCHSLIRDLASDFSYMTSTLQPLRMSGTTRDAAAAALIPPAKMENLLYVLLVAGGQIVTLLRPKKHSVHPSDLHILLNILKASPALRTSDTWLPICLPKFNSEGFVYAFISYVREEIGMIFLSADRDAFEALREWKDAVEERLKREKLLDRIEESIRSSPFSVLEPEVPGLRHFFYKSRKNVQITAPAWEGPYEEDGPTRWSLVTLYQTVYDAIHARSGQGSPLKQLYIKTEDEACMGWITQPFELYLAVSPDLSKQAVVSAANAIVKWVTKQEARLFLREAPVF